MHLANALVAGFLAGGGIAMQFGAVSALLVETAVTAGPRSSAAAGLGVATVDTAFAIVAVVAGGEARRVLAGHGEELRAAAAVLLAVIAIRGLQTVLRGATSPATRGATSPATGGGAAAAPALLYPGSPARHYLRFIGLTSVNPLTVIYFASVATSLSLVGTTARVAFVAGVGVASGLWHLFLTLGTGLAGRRMTANAQRLVAIGGRLVILGMAIRFGLTM